MRRERVPTVKRMSKGRLRLDDTSTVKPNWRLEAVPAPWIGDGVMRAAVLEWTSRGTWEGWTERAWWQSTPDTCEAEMLWLVEQARR